MSSTSSFLHDSEHGVSGKSDYGAISPPHESAATPIIAAGRRSADLDPIHGLDHVHGITSSISAADDLNPDGNAGGKFLKDAVTLDEVIETIGIGSFQYWSLLFLGLANASDAVEIVCLSFILPHLGDPNAPPGETGMTDTEKSILSASIFAGMLIGSISFGVAADKYGRRSMLALALIFNSCFGFLSATTSSFTLLMTFRIFAGFGVGGSIPGVFTLAAEILPTKNRGLYLSTVAWWWMVGSLIAAGIAWSMLGTGATGWKPYAAVCAIPALIATLLVRFGLPESPRWLLLQGRESEARAVLASIARRNKRPSLLDDENVVLITPVSDSSPPSESLTKTSYFKKVVTLQFLSKPLESFFHPQFRTTSILLMIVWFALSFGWYGLILWIPSLFKAVDLGVDPYQDAFVVAASNLPGTFISAVLMERVGRKPVLAVSLFLACLSAIALPFATTKWQVVAAACSLNIVSTCSWNVLDCLSTEVFPTSLRTTAMGFLTGTGRIGSIIGQLVFGNLIHKSKVALLVTAGIVLAFGSGAAAILPKEMMGQNLDDVVSQDTKLKGPYTQVKDEIDEDVTVSID